MSTEGSFRQYLEAIVDCLLQGEPTSHQRLREVVGAEAAIVQLDDEIVEIGFDPAGAFRARERRSVPRHRAWGGTSSGTVLALLEGELEPTDAIRNGHIDSRGSVQQVTAIAAAIDVLLDAATRIPRLMALARRFREQKMAAGVRSHGLEGQSKRERDLGEIALLTRLDLLQRTRS